MNRKTELALVTLFLLLAALLRIWDLSRLPPGFQDNELAAIRVTETARDGGVAVYYQVGDGHGHAGMMPIGNTLVTAFVGDGLLGYRLFSVWGGLLTLAVLYVLARRLFGSWVALIALGVMSVNFRAVLLSRTVTAEAFVPLYTLLTLYVLAAAFHLRREIHFRAPMTLPFALLALLLGAAGYINYTCLVLAPVGVVWFACLLWTRQPLSRRVWNGVIFTAVLAAIIAAPFLISTLRYPRTSEPYILWSQRPHSLFDGIESALRAVGGVIWRGDPRATSNLPDAALVDPVVAILLIVGVVEALRRWREPGYALILITLAAGLLTDAWVGLEPTFSANLVALPAICILPGIGAVAFWRRLQTRGVRRAWQPVALLLALALIWGVLGIRTRLFGTWSHSSQVADLYHANLGRLAAYLDRTADGLPVSICSVPLHETDEVHLSVHQALGLMMHREDMPIRYSDCRGGLVLINAGAPMRFVIPNLSDRQLMPPELADWLKDARPIRVSGLADGTVLLLDVEQRIRDAGGYWGALSPTFFVPDQKTTDTPAPLPVTFERNLTFAGYDPKVFEGVRVPGGDPIVLVTYWRVDGVLPPGLGIFTHLLAFWEDPQTGQRVPVIEPWAESNTIDVIPSELQNRDFFVQVSDVWLGKNLKPGDYALMIGAYDRTVYSHLGVLDRQTGQPRGDRLFLGTIQVVAAQ